MTSLRIIKRELVMRITTEKGSVLYEPVKPTLYVSMHGGLSRAFYECDEGDADGAVFDIKLLRDADEQG